MSRQPAIFIGHGSPLNTIQDNSFTRALRSWGESLSPKAILCVSAHWWIDDVAVTDNVRPNQIYDFGGFPDELYEIKYPCIGSPELAVRMQSLAPVKASSAWGIDHGAWTVLRHLFPDASIPVVQLSLSKALTGAEHWALGERLKPLRDEGVLIVGSGNIVHSFWGFRGPENATPHPLGVEFENKIVEAIESDDADTLTQYESLGPAAKFSAPSADHYWPLIYPLATKEASEKITYPHVGYQYASMSMRCLQIG